MTANRENAEQLLIKLLEASDRTKGGGVRPEAGATMAAAFALLDVADAIREQTEALHLGGVRDDLGEIGHAIRSRES